MNLHGYEAVIGLEVHAELKTATKIFCACPTTFGAPPNTLCCPVCLGLPGALPTLNRRAVTLAVRAGLALGCEISRLSRTDRKQYFYPDLPKAYQISQDAVPLCRGGEVEIDAEGGVRSIRLRRIHIEEDAGKLIHIGSETLIDCNRCGVPLIEIVTEPDMKSPAEASAFLRALRDILVACEVSDCKMHEGSMRCDVNVSLARVGESRIGGVRCEIKNINSFAFVEKAIAYELARQAELLSRGETLQNETRRFDAAKAITEPMRSKETAADYRYLAEPDLPALRLSESDIEEIRATLPELPRARRARFVHDYGVTEADAAVLASSASLAAFFEQAAAETVHRTTLSGMVLTELLRHSTAEEFASHVAPSRMAALATLAGEGTVNSSTAKALLARLQKGDFDLIEAVKAEGLAQLRDPEKLRHIINAVIEGQPQAVADYQSGKTAALHALLGQVMRQTRGRADPVLAEALLKAALA